MANPAFEPCMVSVGGNHQTRQGYRARCGHCPTEETLAFNSVTTQGRGYDPNAIEQMVIRKFEKHGWKIGKTPSRASLPEMFYRHQGCRQTQGQGYEQQGRSNAEFYHRYIVPDG